MERPNHNYRRLRNLPRLARILVGALLVVGGAFGFLPVLGFWMIPLGVVVIFVDVPMVKRVWSRARLWWRARLGRTRVRRG